MDLIAKIYDEESFLINKKVIDKIQIDRTKSFDMNCAIVNVNTNICCLGKGNHEISEYNFIEIIQNELKTYTILKNKNLFPIENVASLESLHSFEILFADYLDFYKKQLLYWLEFAGQEIAIKNWAEMIGSTIIEKGIFNNYENIKSKDMLIEIAFGHDYHEYLSFQQNFKKESL